MNNSNIKLNDNFKQVCVWPGTVVGDGVEDFVSWIKNEFDVRVQYLEEIKTNKDRNDLFFAVHNEDVIKFAMPKLQIGGRWLDDVYFNNQGYLYTERVVEYKCW